MASLVHFSKLTGLIMLLAPLFIQAETLHVIDSAGREVILDKPAQRIIALAPHIVENVFSAGAGNQLVGAASFSNYPPDARTIPVVGGYHSFSLEKIAALQPDLIITWSEGNHDDTAGAFEALGVPVYVDESQELKDIAQSVRNIGLLSGNADQAYMVADHFLQRLSSLQKRYTQEKIVTVFYQVWNKPLQTVNNQHMISSVIDLCGGRNIIADTPAIAPKVSVETVIARDPEVIIASGMDIARPEWLDEWRLYPQLSAVVSDNLYFIPPDILQRHTLRLLEGAERLCESLQQARHKSAIKATMAGDHEH